MADGWAFEIEEVSQNVYRVAGRDPLGRRVERTGRDPDTLLERVKRDAAEISDTVDEG